MTKQGPKNNAEKIKIKQVNEWEPEQIKDLYLSAGWWDDSSELSAVIPMIKGSYIFAVAVNYENKAVGMGRIISDKASTGYIQDLCVLKEYRGFNIGTRLLQFLISKCKNHRLKLKLVAEPNTTYFYEKNGFSVAENTILLKLHKRDNE